MRKENLLKRMPLLIVFLIFFITQAEAQENEVISNLEYENYSQNWEIYESFELVDIFYRYSDCSDPVNGVYPEHLLFKVVNKTNKKIYVYWEFVLFYNNQPEQPAPDENLVQVHLGPNERLEGTCDNLHQTKLGVFFRYKEKETLLTDFQFNELNEFKLN